MRLFLLAVKIILVSGVFALPAGASCNASRCTDEIVKRIYLPANGKIYIDLGENSSALNCTRVSNVYVTVLPTHGNKEEIYAMLLAAQNVSKPISYVRIIENSNECEVSYVYQNDG